MLCARHNILEKENTYHYAFFRPRPALSPQEKTLVQEMKETQLKLREKVTLPYIPGYLAFREVPNICKAYEKLSQKPDILMVDGHGIMHPRRLGIASHLGVLLGVPTCGVAKKKLVGKYEEPDNAKGDTQFVYDKDEVIGAVMRSKQNVKPIFVSAGHMCVLRDAVELTLETLRSHKLPEPTRIADKYSKELKATALSSLSLS